jgi:hypothetical protein
MTPQISKAFEQACRNFRKSHILLRPINVLPQNQGYENILAGLSSSHSIPWKGFINIQPNPNRRR